MANIKLDWSGATSSIGIKGYEIDYKEFTDSLWSNFPFITTAYPFGTYTWTNAEYNKNYNFRIRTVDTDDNKSVFKNLSFSTIMYDNQPPTTFSDYSVTDRKANQLTLELVNSSDDYEIKGHEIKYKKISDITFTTLPFIETNLENITITIDNLQPDSEYEILVRTLDVFDVWSVEYFTIVEYTISPYSFKRSNSGLITLNIENGCYNLTLGSNSVYSLNDVLEFDNVLYINSSLTNTFNGLDRVWKIGMYSARINTYGKITEIIECL